MIAALLTADRATLTNLICTHSRQRDDWSSAYRLYSKDRVDESVLFDAVLKEVLGALADEEPLVVALDDTVVRKRGTHIAGVSWRRDPLGPQFQTNFIRAQRYLQMSAAWPLGNAQARMVPILFHHTPSAKKPGKDASVSQISEYKEQAKQRSLNSQAIEQIRRLRSQCPTQRKILLCGDGSYTNATLIKELPKGCTYIGRARKDAKLHYLPLEKSIKPTGRPRRYGLVAPTPEQLRTDDSVAWSKVRAFAAGTHHDFKIKTLDSLLWRNSGTQQTLRLMIIAPLGYRLTQGAKLLYRAPAYLLCTDPNLAVEQLIQAYLWRWGIETNFRDEKSLIGVGDAQVRTPASNSHLPAVMVAAYSMLLVAALRLYKAGSSPAALAQPKWRTALQRPNAVPSCGELLRTLRSEIWGRFMRPSSLYHFASSPSRNMKPQKASPDLPSMLFCAA
jgi:hypothetical protein